MILHDPTLALHGLHWAYIGSTWFYNMSSLVPCWLYMVYIGATLGLHWFHMTLHWFSLWSPWLYMGLHDLMVHTMTLALENTTLSGWLTTSHLLTTFLPYCITG